MTSSVVDQLRELREKEAAIIDKAKEAAIDQAETAVRLLNELGFDYRFILHVEGRTKKNRPARKRGAISGGLCKICGFKTEPPHDARHHRYQGDEKVPFTEIELRQKGLNRVGEEVQPESMERKPEMRNLK